MVHDAIVARAVERQHRVRRDACGGEPVEVGPGAAQVAEPFLAHRRDELDRAREHRRVAIEARHAERVGDGQHRAQPAGVVADPGADHACPLVPQQERRVRGKDGVEVRHDRHG